MGRNSLGLLKKEHKMWAYEVQCPGGIFELNRGMNLGTFHKSYNEELILTFWFNLKHI